MHALKSKIIIANWKAYVTTRKALRAYFGAFAGRYQKAVTPSSALVRSTRQKDQAVHRRNSAPDIVLCIPFPFLDEARQAIQNLKPTLLLGAQDVFWEPGGPYTGAVTPPMLKDAGVSYVIVGHSERRKHFSETDDVIAKKVRAALDAGIGVILCVGESARAADDDQMRENLDTVRMQLGRALEGVKKSHIKNIIVVYEPVWAISGFSGVADTPENAARMILYIRRILAKLYDASVAKTARVIYGGSVSSQNVAGFLREETIDGVLPGHASANPREFLWIIRAVVEGR